METLNFDEIEEVSGGRLNAYEASIITLALMGMGGPVAMGVGAVALMYYAWC